MTYSFTAALSNTLLLSQVVLGATLTALGASESSHVLITIFGVLNTIIAGLVAYLKSRGQPMRARMFRDDLEHVVDEIENSKTMWLGIKKSVHGYDEIDVDDKISVRSEVARLTRLYETAVKKYMQNNPDMYSMGGGMLDAITGLRARPGAGAQLPPVVNAPDAGAATTAVPAPLAASPAPAGDADESPATAKDPAKNDKSAEESPATAKDDTKSDDKGKEKDELTNPTANANQHDDADATAGATSKEGTEQADSEPASAPVKSNEDDLPSKDDHNGDGEAPTKPKDDPVNGK
ncbi:uncharacterized protein KY384_003784 [Bacidia gigantensis]|uniref:uncharacterized protein n=1 Tax=Bacidia gigantensis TaxID=2732470 RepID=UPI001D03CFAD|nr:uncharacterized protein KY384_003784 [Bacidia gigantensis]KAG8532144.1 hypothetical protein KY384_003784 [Bacidia gigantensis]